MVKVDQDTVEITDIGPVKKASVPIVPGQVTVLVGPNGSGKSTCIRAVQTGLTGKNAGVTPRDGRPQGAIRVPGCTIRVGARVSKQGTPEHSYAIIEDGDGISRLIDPGIKDPHGADRKRLEAMLTATGVECNEVTLQGFLGGQLYDAYTKYRGKLRPKSIVDAAADIRRWLQEQARASEELAAECTGAIAEIHLPSVVGEPVDAERLKNEHIASEFKRQQMQAERDAADNAIQQIAAFGQDLPSVGQATDSLNTAAAAVESLEAQLQEAKMSLELCVRQHEQAMESARKFDDLKACINTGPDQVDVEAAAQEAETRRQEYESAVVHNQELEQAQQDKTRVAELKSRRDQEEANGNKYRDLATRVPDIFRAAVEKFEGWSIDGDLRLCVDHKRGASIPFGDLSPGERAIRAIGVVVGSKPDDDGTVPVVSIDQTTWESLDGDAREQVCEFAQQHGVAILTAEAYSPSVDTEQGNIQRAGVDPGLPPEAYINPGLGREAGA